MKYMVQGLEFGMSVIPWIWRGPFDEKELVDYMLQATEDCEEHDVTIAFKIKEAKE